MPSRRCASACAPRTRPGRRAGRRALARHGLPQRGRDLLPEALDRARVVAHDDEGAEAVLEHERQQLLDPLLRRALEEAAARAERALDVEQPADLARIAPGGLRRVVDRAVGGRDLVERHVGERRQPPVGLGAGEAQHARLVRAQPDRDVVRRLRAALGAVDAVVLAVDAHAPARRDVPDPADDVDRLAQRVDALPRRQPLPAHRLDRRPRTRRRRAPARRARPTAGPGSRPRGPRRPAGAAGG